MKKITFVTTNNAKFEWAKRRFKKYNINLIQKKLDIPETRDFEVEKVVKAKILLALKKINPPFFMDDTSFLVESLNNFPGTFIKLATNILGVNNICILANKYKNKKTNLKSALGYIDEKKSLHIFVCNDIGKISSKPKGKDHYFGDISKIHIPQDFNKTIAQMSPLEFKEYEKKIEKQDHYIKFIKWLNEK